MNPMLSEDDGPGREERAERTDERLPPGDSASTHHHFRRSTWQRKCGARSELEREQHLGVGVGVGRRPQETLAELAEIPARTFSLPIPILGPLSTTLCQRGPTKTYSCFPFLGPLGRQGNPRMRLKGSLSIMWG